MIEVKNITKKYGSLTAVDNISFKINEGEIIGLLGPNGAGKSTTMNMITGYIEPTEGEILIEGYDISKKSKKAKEQIKHAPKEIKSQVKALIDDMAAQMRVSKNLTVANIKNAVKQQRPYSHFILPGAALGALVAYAYNVVGTINED